MTAELPAEIAAGLRRLGLAGPGPVLGEPLTGGVSSDVWRVDLPDGPVCAKRALPRLKVAGDWRAPTERSGWEARWLALAAELLPGAACRPLGYDADGGVLVLEWLDPSVHRVWKERLAAGDVDVPVAAEVGRRLAVLHSGAARRRPLSEWEPARELFATLRIDPYLTATARAHPRLAPHIEALAGGLASAAITVIHGDVSPKNILLGPDGPVLLDAECASPGDPAFDLAFCANHLLLKAVWRPAGRARYIDAARALAAAYLDGADWEPAGGLEARAARLLPALALARVDGLSPVEYLGEDARRTVRHAAARLVERPPDGFADLTARWLDLTDTPGEPA
ncbi:phosphotransferase family protein [Actinomadura nitritigenes]|uniref:phosphotransferase family protein n=1 Tax=Actinomadura nitritigenes TaxID=134602 RepID=UPI003D8E6DB3